VYAQQVVEAARRVAQLRGKVPEAISQHFKERLQACRPVLQTPELEMAVGHADTGVPPAALSPAPAELKGKLADAATQMPMLRCNLTGLTGKNIAANVLVMQTLHVHITPLSAL
jgi:hypothetical protein